MLQRSGWGDWDILIDVAKISDYTDSNWYIPHGDIEVVYPSKLTVYAVGDPYLSHYPIFGMERPLSYAIRQHDLVFSILLHNRKIGFRILVVPLPGNKFEARIEPGQKAKPMEELAEGLLSWLQREERLGDAPLIIRL